MTKFIKELELCQGFFNDCAKLIIDKYFPGLQYSTGLIGYGSDVLGYDDGVSRNHMWGSRFYMFLNKNDIDKKDEIFSKFAENYWNLVIKYDLRQMRRDGKSSYSKIETIFKQAAEKKKNTYES